MFNYYNYICIIKMGACGNEILSILSLELTVGAGRARALRGFDFTQQLIMLPFPLETFLSGSHLV